MCDVFFGWMEKVNMGRKTTQTHPESSIRDNEDSLFNKCNSAIKVKPVNAKCR